MYYVLDDYREGIIYAGASKADLQMNLPNNFEVTDIVLESLNYKGEFISCNKNGEDYVLLKLTVEDLITYMSSRNALNFIKGV